MKRKNTRVSVKGMHPDVWPDLFRLDEAWRRWLGFELTLTSCRDGKHSSTSDHYWGGGFDTRTWTTPNSGVQIKGAKRKQLFQKVKKLMGINWYVEDEADHFHYSYRPRSPS